MHTSYISCLHDFAWAECQIEWSGVLKVLRCQNNFALTIGYGIRSEDIAVHDGCMVSNAGISGID